eukprot:TRINITY_DN921_c0_g3_i2.p1 TRINITY_DN921_c0_g3~~TRINITY_DN921_c0_g3_i2.p1  ORF type:complete len:167 (+),score=38.14 TRINITY_DN921_c0_g3_i2:3-503(+)
MDASTSCCPISSISMSSAELSDPSYASFGQSQHLTNLNISSAGEISEDILIAIARIPNLMSLSLRCSPSSAWNDRALLAFAHHPHLEILAIAFRLVDSPVDVSCFTNALPLIMLRNEKRRQWWQRICCMIAFERANCDSALHGSFIPFVESQYWLHPNNVFSAFLS